MKTIPVIPSPKKPESRTRKTRQSSVLTAAPEHSRLSDSERIFLHDVVNQLTIISLACFELQYPAAEAWSESQKKAINAIENAVQSAAELVEQLRKILKDQNPDQADTPPERSSAPTHPTNNVYPISPYLNLKNR